MPSELEQPLEGSIPETVVCVCVSGWGGVWERNSHLSDIRLVSNTVESLIFKYPIFRTMSK